MWIRPVAYEPRAGLAIALALALLQPPAWGQAVPPGPAARMPATAQDELLILTVLSNGVPRGEFTLLRTADGDYWVGAQDLPRLELAPVDAARRQIGGDTYYSFRALGASSVVFNEADLALNVNFPAERIEGTRIDLARRLPPLAEIRPQTSLIMSYRLSLRHGGAGQPVRATLNDDLNVRWKGLLLRQEMELRTGTAGRRFVRGFTQAIWDSTSRGTRLMAGDVVSSAGRFGSTITGAGLLYNRLFDLTPDLIKQPTATLHAATQLPAEVVVAVDGSPVARARVGPGPITLSNLESYGGTRNVRVTVTDIAGRTEVFEQLFLFTDQVLAKGLHDYSYFAGRRSELASDGWRYRQPAWQAYHAYGVSDSLTVAAGGEGSSGFAAGGAGATVRSDTLGLISADVLASGGGANAKRATGWSARYSYVLPNASILLGRRQYGDGFRGLTTTPDRPFLRHETRAGLAVRALGASWSADLLRSADARETRLVRSLRVSTNLSRKVTLSGQYQSIVTNGKPEWSAQVFLRVDLDAQQWVSSTARAGAGTRGLDLEAGRQIGQGEDFGYRGGVTTTSSNGNDSALGYFSGTWNLRPASLEVFGSSQLRGGGGQYAEAAVSGALVAIDGYTGLTRRVNDGFVLAQLGVAQPGVDILLNNQVQGQTDSEGKLFIPHVGSYGRQDVALNDKQLGMQFSVNEKRRTVTLPYRSGMVVDFGARKVRAVAGMVWLLAGGKRTALASGTLTLKGPGGTLSPETSPAGDFYLDDAPPGSYTGLLETKGKVYSCRMSVPEFPEPVHELKEGVICE